MFVDTTGDSYEYDNKGDLYLMTKAEGKEQMQRLVKIPAFVHENLKENDILDFSPYPVAKPTLALPWTEADMSDDGSLITLRDYDTVYFFPRSKYMSVAQALGQAPCKYNSKTVFGQKEELYFETVSFTPDKRFFAEAPECSDPRTQMCDVKVTVHGLSYNDTAIRNNSYLLPLSSDSPSQLDSQVTTPVSAPASIPVSAPASAPTDTKMDTGTSGGDDILIDSTPNEVVDGRVEDTVNQDVDPFNPEAGDEYYWYYYYNYYYDYDYEYTDDGSGDTTSASGGVDLFGATNSRGVIHNSVSNELAFNASGYRTFRRFAAFTTIATTLCILLC